MATAKTWCWRCDKWVSAASPCDHADTAPTHEHGGDDAEGPGDAARSARDGDDSLESATRSFATEAKSLSTLTLGSEQADRLVYADHKDKQDVLLDLLAGALATAVRLLRLSTVDLLGALDLMRERVLSQARHQQGGK
jgi:hypothetical protein